MCKILRCKKPPWQSFRGCVKLSGGGQLVGRHNTAGATEGAASTCDNQTSGDAHTGCTSTPGGRSNQCKISFWKCFKNWVKRSCPHGQDSKEAEQAQMVLSQGTKFCCLGRRTDDCSRSRLVSCRISRLAQPTPLRLIAAKDKINLFGGAADMH